MPDARNHAASLHRQTLSGLVPAFHPRETGDAFFAGLLYGYMEGEVQFALDFGNATCALAHTIEGDVNLCSVEEIEALVRDENIGKLLR